MGIPKGYVHEKPRKPAKPIGSTPIGDRVKQERLRMGFKLQELANLVGCNQSQITRLENAGAIPRFPVMVKIAQALDCSLDWIAGLED